MSTHLANSPVQERSAGRGYLWLGIGLSVLGVALFVAQFALHQMIVPWYMPALTTLGVLLLLGSLARRRSITRFVALVLIVALAGFQWFLLLHSKLPSYEGPARAGLKMPAFQTALADGRSFSDKDLQDGTLSVLTFFRGRW